jgi:hypothetical protein
MCAEGGIYWVAAAIPSNAGPCDIRTGNAASEREGNQMTGNRVIAITLITMSVSGCGVTLEAKRVTSSDDKRPTPSAVSGSGVVYALPRTDFEIVQVAKVSSPTSGPLQDVFETCRRSCDATGDAGTSKACDFDNTNKVKWSSPNVRTVSGPDYSRLYQVSPAADAFQSLDFKFDIGANGVLDKADTAATNMSYEILSSVLTTAIKAAGAAAPALAMQLQGKKTSGKGQKERDCYEVSTSVDKLTEAKTGTLTCSLVREIRSCLAHFESEIDAERTSLNKLFDQVAFGAKLDSKLLDSLAANRNARIDRAVSKRDAAAALYGLGEGKPKEASYQIVIPLPGPAEFVSGGQEISLRDSIEKGIARITGISDNTVDLLPELTANAGASTRVYRVDTSLPANISVASGEESKILGGGYRYRIPTPALTTLSVFTDTSGTTLEFLPLAQYLVIAQYGPIAALPSNFKGKGGRVMVKLWPDSGGLQTVAIGADPIPSTAVTGVVDEAFTQYKSRQDKAAGADPELDRLTRQQKILSLQKEIKDLQDGLNK